MKMYLSKVGKDAWGALLAVCSVGLAACSSPAEKASRYYEKGLALMVQGDVLKALAPGELSMWCESSKLRCTAPQMDHSTLTS
ncbi:MULTISPECIES: hypothetical protein [unclassified Pseudomonas]|uniref:hypothetical protein n=1 Tax=unclassified Pseudomonas TaxID=196821 RepID=UPI000CD23E93|nr:MULTISPECIES: hypothetical protein [unclassified Pseudomonas]POA33865.1 hypothetical protein C1887_05350 [Pseudomonas sp. GW456-R21]POA65929.1 hypothetical protein C1884_16715 [Pseudomonas sp. GW460-R15]